VPLATALAEEALQDARRNTADAFVIYQPSPRRATERALNTRCATEIVSCLREERFRLAFQPIVNAKTGLAEMHEALLRLQETSSGELIAASHLVPVAENLGLIRLVDRAVMKLILQELGNHENIRLTMNVSGATSTDPFWYGQLLESLEANPKTAGRLMIEIAESVAMRDGKTIRNFVERLRTAGCGVAIDDFGSAHMSYHKLKELPVSMIKLDGAFIRDLSSSSDNEFVVRNMIDLASKLNLKTTAEWVESAEDAEALKSWGVDFMQGQYFGSASVERPWGAMEPGIFEMSQPEAQKPAPAVETAVEPAPKAEVSPETKQAVPEVPQQPAAEHPASDSSAPELNFSEIDSSILRLRKMLGTFPPAADGSERDAA
jgi:EAL domain-containing protein (putative c-di-GMP-specific phosphodiesterase class I)